MWRFNRVARRESQASSQDADVELSLLKPDDLEETLAADTLANAIHNACSEELFGPDKRLGLLINHPDLVEGPNPLGPENTGKAVMDALREQKTRMKVSLLMMSLLSRHVPERVRHVYQDLNRKLIERNVLPTIRVGLPRHRVSPRVVHGLQDFDEPAQRVPVIETPEVGFVPASSADVFGVLQRLIQGNPAIGQRSTSGVDLGFIPGPALPGEPGSASVGYGSQGFTMRPGTFLYALNQLQYGEVEGVGQAGRHA